MRPERESPRGKIMKPATHEEGPTVVVKEATKEGLATSPPGWLERPLAAELRGFLCLE